MRSAAGWPGRLMGWYRTFRSAVSERLVTRSACIAFALALPFQKRPGLTSLSCGLITISILNYNMINAR
jgi:hypothetical protein